MNHALVKKKKLIKNKVTKFNENAWLNQYIDMNTDLRKKAKNDFEE